MKQTIILVEDELLIALDIKEILELEVYEVILNVPSVEKQLQLLKKLIRH